MGILYFLLGLLIGILIGFWAKNQMDEGKNPTVVAALFLVRCIKGICIFLFFIASSICSWAKSCLKKSKKIPKVPRDQT